MTTSSPQWRQLADRIEKDIRDGQLLPGQSLPSLTEMRRSGIGQTTAIAALRYLDGKKLIIKVPGKGTFVADTIPEPAPDDENLLAEIADLRQRIEMLERWRDQSGSP